MAEDVSELLHIAYLGPEASFSHQAAIEVFQSPETSSGPTPQLHPLPSFQAIFQAIQFSTASKLAANYPESDSVTTTEEVPSYDYAVIPIENSTNGAVVQVLDLLAQCGLDDQAKFPDVEVCGEYYLSVSHCLFVAPQHDGGTSEEDLRATMKRITTLYSHPQVWGQCERFLSEHFHPYDVKRESVSSTSAAAKIVAENPASVSGLNAAICSKLAGQRHGLVCLASHIEDDPGMNTTRFIILRDRTRTPNKSNLFSTSTSHVDGWYKHLISFTISHTKPGALATALAIFSKHKFNLTSIDTRPSRKRNWQYVFFVECKAAECMTEDQSDIKHVVNELKDVTESLGYLGAFADQLA
jgi:prephenate dehydratase